MLACKSGYLDLVRALLNEGAELDALDRDDVTAFGHAITSEKGENIGLLELLLEKGADVSKGKFEWSAEDSERRRPRPDKKIKGFAGIKGDMGSYSEIHKKKKFYGKSGRSVRGEAKGARRGFVGFESEPVGIAIRRKFEAVAIKLLRRLGSHQRRDSHSGNSYLHLAVFCQNWKVVDFLLEQGLHPDVRNNHEKSAWFFCQDEDAQARLRSFVDARSREPNFKKKKTRKLKKKRKRKKLRPVAAKPSGEPPAHALPPKQSLSIEQSSSQNASSKGGFLLSQLSLDPDSQGNKLLQDISRNDSSSKKTDRNLWDDLSVDSKLDLKNNLSTDRSTQDLQSEVSRKKELKKELKNECRKLQDKLSKLIAENDLMTADDFKKSVNSLFDRPLSDLNKPLREDSLMLENVTCANDSALPRPQFPEPNASMGKLLDIISNHSAVSGVQDPAIHRPSCKGNCKAQGCRGCLGLLARLPLVGETRRLEARLGAELLEFEAEVAVVNSAMRAKYMRIQTEIEHLIEELHSGPFELKVYGSFANGLNIPGSDLDLLLVTPDLSSRTRAKEPGSPAPKLGSKHRLSEDLGAPERAGNMRKYTDPYQSELTQEDFQNKLILENVMEDLNDKAQSLPRLFSQAKYLRNAQIPVLKLNTCPALGGFPVDVTVADMRHQGLECVDLVKTLTRKYPPLKPVVLVLKQLLTLSDLSDPYMGGLSSYALVVMVVAYFQTLEHKEAQREPQEPQLEADARRLGKWGEDARLSHQKGSRRTSSKKSFTKSGKAQKSGSRVNLPNGLAPGSRRVSVGKKKGARGRPGQIAGETAPIFSRSEESVGRLLLGFLHFFAFEFNMHSQQVRIFLGDEDVQWPVRQVCSPEVFA